MIINKNKSYIKDIDTGFRSRDLPRSSLQITEKEDEREWKSISRDTV